MGGKQSKTGKSRKIKKIHKHTQYIGLICAYFTAVQASIGIILSIVGITCFFTGECGIGTVFISFNGIYMDSRHVFDTPSFISPPIVFITIIVIYLALSITWLYFSCNLIVVFKQWTNFKKIKKAANQWITVMTIVCIVDLIIFLFFMVDAICLSDKYGSGGDDDGKSRSMFAEGVFYGNKPSNVDLVNTVKAQRERIKKLKEDVNSTNSTMENKTVENNILNPFLQKKIWEKVRWPTKHKLKEKNITSERKVVKRYIWTIVKEPHMDEKKSDKPSKPSGPDESKPKGEKEDDDEPERRIVDGVKVGPFRPVLPPFICMVVALRGLVVWIANIFLLWYLEERIQKFAVKRSKFRFNKRQQKNKK